MSVRRSMGERRNMPIRKELATITDLETGARVIPSGSDLYRQGEICSTYYVVLSGWIALSALLDDGSCQILDFALPGAVLGFQSGAGAPMYHSARCLSVVRVYAFPRASWIQSSKAIHASLFCSAAKSPAMRHAPTIISPTLGCEVRGSASPVSCSRSM